MKNWTKEEHALLAHLIGVHLETSDNILDACEFASKKLGRSKAACYAQYHNKMRDKDLTDFALTTEQEEELMQGSDYDIDKESVSVIDLDDLAKYTNIGFMNLQDAKESFVVPEINVYSGFKQECKIIVHTDAMIVAEFGGSIITIKF